MIRRKTTILSLISLAAIFMLLTISLYIVNDYRTDSEFTTIAVGEATYASDTWDANDNTIGVELTAWAKENRATLFYSNYFSSGIAVADCSGWFQDVLDIDYDGLISKTVIVSNTDLYNSAYIDKDILYPGLYDYKIIGKFNSDLTPSLHSGKFYYYPMQNITSLNGELITHTTNKEALSDLLDTIENSGRFANITVYAGEGNSVLHAFRKMIIKDPSDIIAKAITFAIISLLCCAFFTVFMMYRENNRVISLNHLYGATYTKIFNRHLAVCTLAAISGAVAGNLIIGGIGYSDNRALFIQLAMLSLIYNVILVFAFHLLCFFDWRRSEALRERR